MNARARSGVWPRVVVVTAVSGLVVIGAACGGDDSASTQAVAGASSPTDPATAAGSGDVARGQQLAKDSGCQSCHKPGGGGIGPDWEGLYGSDVQLDDGTTVVADDAYLTRAITDPGAQKVDGYSIAMPENDGLSDADVAALVAYIRSLGDPTTSASSVTDDS